MKIFLDLINLLINFKFCVLITGPKKLKVLCFFSSEVLLKLEKLRRDKWTKNLVLNRIFESLKKFPYKSTFWTEK